MTSVALHADQLLYRIPGGIGTYVRELVPALRRADPSLQLSLFHARFDGPPSTDPLLVAGEATELPWRIRSLYPGWAIAGKPSLPRVLSETDIVQTPTPVAVPPPGPKQRLVVTVHDLAFLAIPDSFPPVWRNLFRWGLRRAVRTADALIAVSRNTASDLERLAGADPARIHVVPLAAAPPAEDAPDPADVAARLGIARPYLLSVGTLEPRKNLVRLIRAYRRAAASGVSHTLVLAGPEGWGAEAVRREAEAEGRGRVVVTGRVDPHDLDALYRGADVFLYPSLYEGFGLPVLEAMARDVPTVIGAAGALPEVAGDASLAVEPRSESELAEAIHRVLGDGELAGRLIEDGRRRAARFTWERTATETLAVYRAVLDR